MKQKRIKRKNITERTKQLPIRIKRKKDEKVEVITFDKKEKIPKEALIVDGIIAFVLLVILILSYIKFGLACTGILLLGIVIILSVYLLLQSKSMSRKKRKIINIVFIIILTLGIIGLVAFSAFLIYVTASAPTFDPDSLATQELSIMYDTNGEIIAKLGAEKREKVTYDELPQVLIDAIISTEDST